MNENGTLEDFGMKVSDINPDDPKWSAEQATVIRHLLKKREQYLHEGRVECAHGVRGAIILVVSVFTDFTVDHEPDYKTNWGEL
jgi:hypothetical protein